MKLNLSTPKEPVEIKEQIKASHQKYRGGSIDWASLNVWFGNQLPKYLWKDWKDKLKPSGFTWQKFLKLLKYRTDKIILWSQEKITWKNLVEEIQELINSPFGENIKK
ncbi:hypothetical protein J7J81_02315 [bacterium]|nr:hypothetical protein [bacterium]